MAGTQAAPPDLYAQARALLAQAKSATLATITGATPFAALVTPAFRPDLSALLLLSQLSPHTRHLAASPACALLITGQPTTENPQTAPRICLTGSAAPDPDPTSRSRYLEVHPYAAQYAGFADFGLWRLTFTATHFIGGFAAAAKLDLTKLRENFGV